MKGLVGMCALALCISTGGTLGIQEKADQWGATISSPVADKERTSPACLETPLCIVPGEFVSQPRTPHALQVVECCWQVARQQHDVRTLQLILSPDFHQTDWTGRTHDRDQALRAAASNSPASTSHLQNMAVRLFGGQFAVVAGDAEINNPGLDLRRVHFTHVFIYRQGRWQAVSSQETAEQAEAARQG